MKVLLVVLTVFAAFPAFADDGIWFKGDSQTCNDVGSELKVNSANDIKIQVSTDLKTINRQLISNNSVSETFKLVKVGGKDKYMAVPKDLEHTDVFYITITESMDVTVHYSDFSGDVCGGGLVVTKLIKDSDLNKDFVEESNSNVAGN